MLRLLLPFRQNKVKRISYLEDVKEQNPPCSFCAEPLTNDIVKVFNQLRLKKTRVWPCCSGKACMRLAVYNKSKREDGFICPKQKDRKNLRSAKELFKSEIPE